MNATHLRYEEALSRAAIRKAASEPVKSEPHCRAAATRKAAAKALIDGKTAKLQAELAEGVGG